MDSCYFCQSIRQRSGLDFINDLETDLFVVTLDANPAKPGHTLIIPKRHAQYMQELSQEEQQALIGLVIRTKEFTQHADLLSLYRQMAVKMAGHKSEEFINHAIISLENRGRHPDAFNDGLNDGPAAGQTVPHFHWHVMPRWNSDMPDPRGGVRHMFIGMGNYHDGLSAKT